MLHQKKEIKRFNNGLWRKSLEDICRKININDYKIEVISPFGFEVFENQTFLEKNLKRFYCYLGVHKSHKISNMEIQCLIKLFSEEIDNVIQRDFSEYLNDFVLKVEGNKFIKLKKNDYVCKRTDKLLDIQFRLYETTLIEDYTDYIISSVSALKDDKDEIKEFMSNSRFRSRTYQLYVMVEKIFGFLISDMNEIEKNYFNKIFSKINNTVEIFYDESKLNVQANFEDIVIMNKLIKPRINKIKSSLMGKDNLRITSRSYHVEDELILDISEKNYLIAKKHIIDSYLNFL